MVSKNSYMDDLIDSVQSDEDARKLIKEVDIVLGNTGFKVKEWIISGDKTAIYGDEVSNDFIEADQSRNLVKEKVLGIKWKVTDDEISCETGLNSSKIEGIETLLLSKRKVLGFVNGICDPLGLVAPVTIKAKLMMRVLWTEE